jgi:hypothetical protein
LATGYGEAALEEVRTLLAGLDGVSAQDGLDLHHALHGLQHAVGAVS